MEDTGTEDHVAWISVAKNNLAQNPGAGETVVRAAELERTVKEEVSLEACLHAVEDLASLWVWILAMLVPQHYWLGMGPLRRMD